MKNLEDMTLEELWRLFPVTLVPHDWRWKQWAAEEMDYLMTLLVDFNPVVNHIGSTAVPGIMAKPIIDILVEIQSEYDRCALRSAMEEAGYICMHDAPQRMSFNKGYTPAGYAERVFHIHVTLAGDNDEIIFRDYLLSHPDVARRYQDLKISLLPRFKYNRDAYTEAKSSFVNESLAAAWAEKRRHL